MHLEVLILENVKVVLVLHFVTVDSKWINGWRHFRSIGKSESTQTGTVPFLCMTAKWSTERLVHGSLQKWKDLSCTGKSRGGEAHYSTGVMSQSGDVAVSK